MTGLFLRFVMLLTLCALQSACTLGYNRMLFMTKTNVGLDVDSRPPTAEVSIARREGFIGPSFEEGKALPVLGSVRIGGNWFSPKILGAFAGGEAAVTVARLFGDNTTTEIKGKLKSKLCLSHQPKDLSQGTLAEAGLDARPFFFATDTTFGLKVAWSGASEAIPDSFKMGYNRKEFAYAPVFGGKFRGKRRLISPKSAGLGMSEARPVRMSYARPGEYEIQIPSFIATIENDVTIAALINSEVKHVQFFATGEAANALALRPEIRKVFVRQLRP